MAISSCPKCGEHSFEQVDVIPKGSHFPVKFIQCDTCGTVVGATDSANVLIKVNQIEDLIKKVVKKQEFV